MKKIILGCLLALSLLGGTSFAQIDTGNDKWQFYGTDIYNQNTGNVGIGTTGNSPKKLYVIGDIYATGGVTCGGSCGGSLSGLTTNKLPKATSSSTIADSQLFDNGTNVGIGSVVPGAFLDVAGAIRSSSTINNITFTKPASAATLTLGSGKTIAISNGITFAGTDSTTMTFPGTSATVARTDAANTFTGHQTIEGVTSTGTTGTGNFVFDGTPTLVTPNIGAATGTSLAASGNVGVAGAGVSTFPLYVKGNVGVGTTTVASTPYQLVVNNVATFNSEFNAAANIGVGTTTINWNNGNYQNIGIGTSQGAYLAFTHPTNGNIGLLHLRIKQDSTGSRAIVGWPTTVLWAGGTAPTLTTTANKSDLIDCRWNGTSDYCVPTLNF